MQYDPIPLEGHADKNPKKDILPSKKSRQKILTSNPPSFGDDQGPKNCCF